MAGCTGRQSAPFERLEARFTEFLSATAGERQRVVKVQLAEQRLIAGLALQVTQQRIAFNTEEIRIVVLIGAI